MVIPVFITVGAATLLILVALVVSLVRQIAGLAGALAQFQEELQPILEDIQRDADRAGLRMQSLRERRTTQGDR